MNHGSKRLAIFVITIVILLALAAPRALAFKDNITGRVWVKVATDPTSPPLVKTHFTVYKDQLWALAYTDQYDATLWRSTDGAHWTPMSAGQFDNNCLFAFKDKLWVLDDSKYTTDGLTWIKAPTSPPWHKGTFGAGFDPTFHDGKIWVILYGALWCSGDGATWTKLASNNLFTRYPKLVSFGGKLWILGGFDFYSGVYQNEAYSSSDGIHWTFSPGPQLSETFNWERVVSYGGRIWWLRGLYNSGSASAILNSVWSSSDGANWIHAPDPPSNIGLNRAFVFNNKIYTLNDHVAFPGILYTDFWTTGLEPGPPVLAPLPTQQAIEHLGFVGPEPEMLRGTYPFTFSLVQAPAGVTIDSASGIVRWPHPAGPGQKYNIILRVTNPVGSTTISLPLSVAYQAPPVISVPAWARGKSCTIHWTAVPDITGYTVQIDDAPDFATPISTRLLTSQTLQCTFNGMNDGIKYYYRVRGNKVAGVTALWSATAASTQDALSPTGSVSINNGATTAGTVFVNLTLNARDLGHNPSGLSQLMLSNDGVHWSAPEPFTPTHTFQLRLRSSVQYAFARFIDRAGNVSASVMAPITLSLTNTKTLYVDGTNTSPIWNGDTDHPYHNLQSAIDGALPGWTIVVLPGTYRENINFKGKNLALRSIDPNSLLSIRGTVINGNAAGPAVTFAGSEGSSCSLSGFTVTNGKSPQGGGIHGAGTHATIQNNFIINNVATEQPSQSHVILVDMGHWDSMWGVPIWIPVWVPITYWDYLGTGAGLDGCQGLVQNNVIAFNSFQPTPIDYFLESHTDLGSALNNCGGTVRNNTIYGNGSLGEPATAACRGHFYNNILAENVLNFRIADGNSSPTYCCIQNWAGGGKGNIAAAAQLNDPLNMDFSLKPASPCIDAGSAAPGLLTDIAGNPRGAAASTGNRGDGSHVDIGAFEYLPLVSQISRTGYLVDTLQAGKPLYIDRAFTFIEPIPAVYKNQFYIRTRNNDKSAASGFSFYANRPVKVIVVYNAAFGDARPAWLAGWTKLSDKLTTSDVVAQRTLYQKSFPAGTITLGPNREGMMITGPSMYTVIVIPQ